MKIPYLRHPSEGFLKHFPLVVMWTAMGYSQAATTGFNQTAVGPWDYNDTANWASSTINGLWDSSLTLAGAQTVTFAADSVLTTGLTFNYTGNQTLTLRSSGVSNQTITLGGDISVNPVSNQTVTIGSATANQNLNVDLGGVTRTFTVGASKGLTFTNVISNGGIIKSGTGTLTLSSANTYTGGTTIKDGTVVLGNANALGTSGTITLGDTITGATLKLAGLTFARPMTIAAGTGTVGIGGQAANLTAAITLNRGISLSSVNVSGGISGTGDVTIDSQIYSGWLTTSFAAVSGGGVANTFNGNLNILSGATLSVGGGWASSNKAIPDASNVNVLGTLNIGIGTNNETINALTGNGTVTAAASGGTLTIGSANGSGTFSGGIGGSGAKIVKTGTGTQTFSGTNTYSGTTTVSNGTLQFAKQASLYNNNSLNWTAANINVKSAATLALNVDSLGTAGFTSANLDILLGNISVAGSATVGLQSGAILGFNTSTANGGTFTQGNAIANSTGGSGGAIGLTKLGTGTLILDKTNTYTGATTVSEGTLIINGSVSNSSLTTVASGATIGGTGSVGALTVLSGGFHNPGNSPGIQPTGNYTLDGTLTIEITGNTPGLGGYDQVDTTGTVDIAGGTLVTSFTAGTYANGNLLFILLNDSNDVVTGTFNTFAQGATVTNYGGFDWQISYTADSTGNTFLGGNDIALMAIPEPGAALIGSLGMIALLRRRR